MEITSLMFVDGWGTDDVGRPRLDAVFLGRVTMPPPEADTPEELGYSVFITWQGREPIDQEVTLRVFVERFEDGGTMTLRIKQDAVAADGPNGWGVFSLPPAVVASMPGRHRLEVSVAEPAGGGSWMEYEAEAYQG